MRVSTGNIGLKGFRVAISGSYIGPVDPLALCGGGDV